jgi:hypothetical protein
MSKQNKSLTDTLKKSGAQSPTMAKAKTPIWRGPEIEGITFSLLSRFLVCRERFRILVCEGLTSADGFNHRIHYGSLWHVAEEAYAACKPPASKKWKETVDVALRQYAQSLCQQYRMQQEQIEHWYNVAKCQFPIYVQYWERHPDVVDRVPLLQEVSFKVPYTLPSGRVVLLRGKWDSVDLIGRGANARIFLQENKTKGEIYEQQLKRELESGFSLQVMIYLTALTQDTGIDALEEMKMKVGVGKMPSDRASSSIGGVRYNVIRRPLSGGKGSIVQHKPSKSNPKGETKAHFYERLGGIIAQEPEFFFMRWRVEIGKEDIARFQRQCLDPILEQLCDWWDWIEGGEDPFRYEEAGVYGQYKVPPPHFRFPYNVWNSLLEGGSTDLDEYLNSGSTIGLRRCENLFPELE